MATGDSPISGLHPVLAALRAPIFKRLRSIAEPLRDIAGIIRQQRGNSDNDDVDVARASHRCLIWRNVASVADLVVLTS